MPCSVLVFFFFFFSCECKRIHFYFKFLSPAMGSSLMQWGVSTYSNLFCICYIFSLIICNAFLAQNFNWQKFNHLDYLDICLWESPDEKRSLFPNKYHQYICFKFWSFWSNLFLFSFSFFFKGNYNHSRKGTREIRVKMRKFAE